MSSICHSTVVESRLFTFNAFFGADCVLFFQEAERETQQKWNPIVEISYRGGKYKGRCQGGLPEGKVLCYSSGTLVKASFPGFSSYSCTIIKS